MLFIVLWLLGSLMSLLVMIHYYRLEDDIDRLIFLCMILWSLIMGPFFGLIVTVNCLINYLCSSGNLHKIIIKRKGC